VSFNDVTIINALAAHLRAATPPTGYTLRQVHAYPPDNLAVVPAAVIVPAEDSVTYGAANRKVTLNLAVTVYLQPQADMARKYQDLMAWRTWLRDSLIDGVTLDGTDAVAQASVTGTSIGNDQWADSDFLTVTATVEISSVEAINVSA
jgi:hypothetical protein